MELTYHKVNIAACQNRQQALVDIVSRNHPGDVWFVPFAPLDFVNTPTWRHFRRDASVAIPLYPYIVPNEPGDALGYAFQLGVRAMHDLGGRKIKRLHLSLGEPVGQFFDESAGQTRWSFHLGFGVVLE